MDGTAPTLYSALPTKKAIRLLRLTRADNPIDALECSLEVFENYANAPSYKCLSYCWGDPTDTVKIKCNGHPIAITSSLHAALVQLRSREEKGYIWADAVCIRQDDVLERNHQVLDMHNIFDNCSQVIVWLGQGDEETGTAMSVIRRIVLGIRKKLPHYVTSERILEDDLGRRYGAGSLDLQESIYFSDFTMAEWLSFWHIYEAEWFRRVWVIQEVRQVQKTWVHCGDHAIEWNDVGWAASWAERQDGVEIAEKVLREKSREGLDGAKNAALMWAHVPQNGSFEMFLHLLDQTRSFKAADARDKVYALLHHDLEDRVRTIEGSLSPPVMSIHARLNLPVDYAKSVLEVYRDIAIGCFENLGHAHALSFAWRTAHVDSSWPSWVPRWDIGGRCDYYNIAGFWIGAASNSKLRYRSGKDNHSIIPGGVSCGEVTSISSVAKYPELEHCRTIKHCDVVQDLLHIVERVLCRPWKYPFGCLADFFAKRLQGMDMHKNGVYISLGYRICDLCNCGVGEPWTPSVNQSFTYRCDVCSNGEFDICESCYTDRSHRCQDPSHVLQKAYVPSLWIPYIDGLVDSLKSYVHVQDENVIKRINAAYFPSARFFQTSLGAHGSTSQYVQVGDVIVVLFGCKMPFVLRKQPGGYYRLISDCYVDDLMDGQAIHQWKRGELHSEEFEIR